MAQQKTSFPEFGFVRLPQILACIPICESAWWEGFAELVVIPSR